MSMLDHLGISVAPSKFDEVVAFYTAALAPLGHSKQIEFGKTAIGFGADKATARFWVFAKEGAQDGSIHLAFSAKDHAGVDGFHAEGVKAGGKDNGAPGIRKYHPNYYASFLIDPVG